jgi:hypothetical protein
MFVAQIFYAPPFNLNTAQIGYLNAGPTVGATLGCLLCMVSTDPVTKWLAKKNNGVYEPEFRLLFMIPLFVCSVKTHQMGCDL